MKKTLSTRKRSVVSYFQEKADHYDDVDKQAYWVLSDKVLWNLLEVLILKKLRRKKVTILDAGGGTGRWGIPIAEYLKGKALLFDISEDMLNVAGKKIKSKKLENLVSIQVGDLEESNVLKPFGFDLSISLHNVLSFVDHPEKALRNIVKATKKNGYVAAVVSNKYHGLYFSNTTGRFQELDRIMKSDQIKFTNEVPPMHTFTPNSLKKLFLKAGVSKVEVYGFLVTIYPNMEETTLGQNSNFIKSRLAKNNITNKIFDIEKKVCLEPEAASRGNMLLAIAVK